ncbi:MAG: hypothetical protein ABSF33_13750, partial [Acidimicrobiales bacterium]
MAGTVDSAFDPPPPEVDVPPTIRPTAAVTPPVTTTNAATRPVTAPADRTARRGRAPGRAGRPDRRSASQVSTAGAPAAPARASGVQAKKKTMSE